MYTGASSQIKRKPLNIPTRQGCGENPNSPDPRAPPPPRLPPRPNEYALNSSKAYPLLRTPSPLPQRVHEDTYETRSNTIPGLISSPPLPRRLNEHNQEAPSSWRPNSPSDSPWVRKLNSTITPLPRDSFKESANLISGDPEDRERTQATKASIYQESLAYKDHISVETCPVESNLQLSHSNNRKLLWDDDHVVTRKASKGDLPNWRPRSLTVLWISGLILVVLACALVYLYLGYVLNDKNGYIAISGSKIDWIFLYGPLFLAVFILEWVGRLKEDHSLIYPYCQLSLSTIDKPGDFKNAILPPSLGAKLNPLPRNRYQTLVLFFSLILVPYQTTIFSKTSLSSALVQTVPFVSVSSSALLNAYNGTTFGPTVLQAIYHGLSGVDSSLKTAFWTSYAAIPGASSVVIMPFLPADLSNSYSGFQTSDAAQWQASTSIIAVGMKCSQVNTINVTVFASDSSSYTVRSFLQDDDGCIFNYDSVNVTRPAPGQTVTVAVWNQLLDHNGGSLQDSQCPSYRQFAVAGQLYAESFDSSNPTTVDTTSAGAGGFGALSCDSYFLNYNDVLVTIDRTKDSQNAVSFDDLTNMDTQSLPGDSTIFPAQMGETLFVGNLTKDLVDPVVGKSFWGGVIESSYEAWDGFNNSANWSCASVAAFQDADWIENNWSNEQACMLYGGVKGIYLSVFTLTAAAVAQFVPTSEAATIQGSLGFSTEAWTLDKFSALVSAIFHGFGILFLLYIGISMRLTITGLYGNPGSIAAKMFYFRNRETRKLFRGLDIYRAKDSLCYLKRRLDASTMRWGLKGQSTPIERTNEPKEMIFVRRQDKKNPETNAWILPPQLGALDSSRFSELPLILSKKGLIALSIIIGGLIAFVFAFILPKALGDGIELWEPPGTTGPRHWINTHLFSLVPVLVLVALRGWWGEVDKFFRIAQPFEGLRATDKGANTLCTQYLTQPDLIVSYQAAQGRHWKLALVTLVTFSVKIAIIAAGTLFTLENSPVETTSTLGKSVDWREGTFAPPTDPTLWSTIQDKTMAASLAGYPKGNGWVLGMHSFLPLDLSNQSAQQPNQSYTAPLQGIKSLLDCSVVGNRVVSSVNGGSDTSIDQWSVQLTNGSCTTGNFFMNTCQGIRVSTDQFQTTTTFGNISAPSGGCYTWTLLPDSACNGVDGFWLITAASSSSIVDVITPEGAATGQLFFSAQPSVTTLICTPQYFNDTVLVDIVPSGPNITLSALSTLSSDQVAPNLWTDPNNSSLGFSSYFSSQLNQSTLVNNLFLASAGVALDPISALMAFNMSAGINGFQSTADIASTASLAFSTIFAAYADAKISQSPFLFQAQTITAGSGSSSQVNVRATSGTAQRAFPVRVPILIVTAGLVVYGASLLLLLYSRLALALPQDVTYLAGQLILIYGNSVIEEMERTGKYEDRWEQLAERRFALGVFEGREGGGEHLGIDVAENVTLVKRWGRRNGFGRKNDRDEKGTPFIGGRV